MKCEISAVHSNFVKKSINSIILIKCYTYGASPIRSYFPWVQLEWYSRLDTWILHWDRIAALLATIDDFQLHRPYCVRIDRRQAHHSRAIELAVAVDLQKKREKIPNYYCYYYYIVDISVVSVMVLAKHKHHCVTQFTFFRTLVHLLVTFAVVSSVTSLTSHCHGCGLYIQLHNNCKTRKETLFLELLRTVGCVLLPLHGDRV